MASLSLTDNLGNPIAGVKADLTSASSLFNYVRSGALHFLVAPDFLARKDQPLGLVAAAPMRFDLKVGNDFQLGGTEPEIGLSTRAQVTLTANASAGSGLIDGDTFQDAATAAPDFGYVGLSLTGDVEAGASASTGCLGFGFDADTTVTIEYVKAFPLAGNQPALGEATGRMFSSLTIPARLEDLGRLGDGDLCRVAGTGTLTVSSSIALSTSVNPLASVNLPLKTGTVTVQEGAMAGLSMDLAIGGGYEIRVRRLRSGTIELSYLTSRTKALTAKIGASAGVGVTSGIALRGETDLVAKLFGVLGVGKVDASALTEQDATDFQREIKASIDHSLTASLDLALQRSREDRVAFQYEIEPGELQQEGKDAVQNALRGRLSDLTRLETGAAADGTIAPGLRVKNSVLSKMRESGARLRVNLLGIVNFLSVTSLTKQCEFIHEPATGDLTIRETVQSERITAITNPSQRQNALRRALFESAMATTAYAISGAVTIPSLRCESTHFVTRPETKKADIEQFLNWFVVLNLLTPEHASETAAAFSGDGRCDCVVRAQLDDAACHALFFDEKNALRPESYYLEIGRQALRALLAHGQGDLDPMRYAFLDDNARWLRAVAIGPNNGLAPLLPILSTDSRYERLLALIIGDVYDVQWWNRSMRDAGTALQAVRTYLAGRDPATLATDAEFARRRQRLQDTMSQAVRNSKARFDEPWGLTCLHWAGGSRQIEGSLIAGPLLVRESGGSAALKSATAPA